MCSVAIAMAMLTDRAWGVVAGAGRSFFLQRVSAKWLGRLSGAVLIGGGIWLSLARRPS
jgi:threonine/homoserine/homoserine lactone efflux protein